MNQSVIDKQEGMGLIKKDLIHSRGGLSPPTGLEGAEEKGWLVCFVRK